MDARRAYWLKTLHQWHWISSAICLLGMLLFAFTGITLNNASRIEANPQVVNRKLELPADLRTMLAKNENSNGGKSAGPLPASVTSWIAAQLRIDLGDTHDAEWSADEIYLPMPRAGGDAWLRIDRQSGSLEYESTDRGWIAYVNDLHKGRHTGRAWSWFIDAFAVACLVFSISGLFILKMHAVNRPTTWPLVALGLVIPLLLAILFIH